MGRTAKSQWDFGELFPPEQVEKALSVAELTNRIKRLLEKDIGEVRVTGEISGLKAQSSGHIYFLLKDATAQLSCVLFRGELQADRSLLQDGRKVVLKGQITVYEPRGSYQLRVTGVELEGIGTLQAAFERLKIKLKAEGMFAPEHKRPLPRYPVRIGLVTSPTGAAIRDVLHVIQRRNPTLEILMAPSRVQGAGAAAEIAAAIHLLNEFHSAALPGGGEAESVQERCGKRPYQDGGLGRPLDLILLTRGGGSLEDLWPFNEEIVARAIFNSALPIVSAVGHEIDFTISDFVADFRAATPSAAAEILTEGMFAGCQTLAIRRDRVRQLTAQQFQRCGTAFTRSAQRLTRLHPSRALEAKSQRLDEAVTGLSRCAASGLRRQKTSFREVWDRLTRARPAVLLARRREKLNAAAQRIRELVLRSTRDLTLRLETARSALRLLGPEQVLSRGYSITMDEKGAILRDAKKLAAGSTLRTRLKTGRIKSRIEQIDTAS